jgi:hypothetical protein
VTDHPFYVNTRQDTCTQMNDQIFYGHYFSEKRQKMKIKRKRRKMMKRK